MFTEDSFKKGIVFHKVSEEKESSAIPSFLGTLQVVLAGNVGQCLQCADDTGGGILYI